MRFLSFLVLVVATPAWAALPAELDPTVTPSIGLREDAAGKLTKDPEATATLIAVLHDDPSPDVRARAAKALFDRWAAGIGDRGLHRGVAIWAAANADDGIRAAAVRALGDIGDDYTLVVGYLDDENAGVRAAAYSACERWIERHPDRADEVRAELDGQEQSMQGKARLFLEKVRAKVP
jgi:HEAT repeat protein